MRLFHLADYHGSYAGSFIPMLRAALLAARDRGWQVEVGFTPVARGRGWLTELEAEGVPVRIAPGESIRDLARWVTLLLAEDPGPTVVHTHFTAFDVPAALAALRRRDDVVVWHLHSRAQPEIRARVTNMVKYGLFGRAVDRILCVAPDLAAAARQRLAPGRKVDFFPNAIDTARFPLVSPERRAAARRQLDVPPSGEIVLHLGWDWERKAGDLFLRAVASLTPDRDRLVPVTVGAGPEARTLGAQLELERLRILEPTDRVQDLYAAADVLASPSRAEGMPFSVAEALCMGVGVVASDIPGHRAICEKVTACRLTSLDPAELATGIRATLDRSPGETEREGREARQSIVARMDLEVWAAKVIDVYDEALSNNDGSRSEAR